MGLSNEVVGGTKVGELGRGVIVAERASEIPTLMEN